MIDSPENCLYGTYNVKRVSVALLVLEENGTVVGIDENSNVFTDAL